MAKSQFFRVARALKPGITKAEYNRMWASFVIEREKHYQLKKSLKIIQGGLP